jgi:hypothetical protein
MPVDHTEKGFEQAIERGLLTGGYRKGSSVLSRCDLQLRKSVDYGVLP